MEQNWKPVLGDVFAFPDALTVQARLRLAALLAVPGRAPAILPGQLASSPLPVGKEVRAAVRGAIEAGLGRPELGALASCRLGAVVPALGVCDPEAFARSVASQLRGLLALHAVGAPLADFTIGQVSGWSGFGPRRVVQLVVAAVGAALDVVGSGVPGPAVSHPTPGDVSTVLGHDAVTGGELPRLLGNLSSGGPPEVGAAAGRLLSTPAAAPDRCLTFIEEVLVEGGDERDRGVFENGVLPLGPVVTRPALAAALGVGVEQVRRLGARAARRVDTALDRAPTAVRELAATVSERLGAVAPWWAVDAVLASLGWPALPDCRSRLLLRLAGPYRDVDGHPGWVALDPAELVAETRRLIHEDGGVRLVEHVAKELHLLGVAADHAPGWLSGQPVLVGDGLVVATTGAPGDIAERALHARGRAMTVDEMAAWVPGGRCGIEALWSSPDRRFVVTGGDALALAEWGDTLDVDSSPPGPSTESRSVTVAVRPAVVVAGGGPAADELLTAHYPDGHWARVGLVPSPRSGLSGE